jgi:signal transduction histidine kinase
MRVFFLIFFICFSTIVRAQDSSSYEQRRSKIIEIGVKSFFAKDTFTLKKSTNQLHQLYLRKKDSFSLAKYYHFKALEKKVLYMNDSAFHYYHESKNISKLLNDSLEVGKRLMGLAGLQRQAKDFLGSQVSSIEALEYLEPLNSAIQLEAVYNVLGIVSNELGEVSEAIGYYEKALEINELNGENEGYLYILNNFGYLYQGRKRHLKAIEYFKRGLDMDSVEIKYPEHYALLLENLAFSNYSIGKPENVLSQYLEVLEKKKELKNLNGLSTTHINICMYYRDMGSVSNALSHAKKAYEYATKSHNNKRWLEALELLSELTSGNEAREYFKEYISLSDSLLQQERGLKNQFARIRFETGKKEKENAFLKSENQRNQDEIVRHKQQKIIGWLAALLAFVGLGFTITVFVFRRRKLLFQAQLQKAEAREQERKQIAKALHDEVAGDLRLLHRKLEKSNLLEEATKLNAVKDNVRNLSHQLSSVSFKKVGFKDQIINLVSDYFEMDFRIFVKGINDYDWEEVDSAIKRLLYICLRETIQNSKNHAEASKVEVTFSIHKKNVLLNVADNGVGFDTSSSKKGIGLQNLQERVEELQGSFAITSERGTGTETHIQIPLNV